MQVCESEVCFVTFMSRILVSAFAVWFISLLPAGASAQERYFESRGVLIRFIDTGEGVPVILVDGFMQRASVWTEAGVTRCVSDRFRPASS